MSAGSTQKALEVLWGLPMGKVKLGLSRMEQALALLGHPERRYACIHVGGSNGKGSTCAMVAACLKASGRRVGLYSSPHLSRVNERFQLNGQPLEDEALAEGIEAVHSAIEGKVALSFFEFCTALAFWLFAHHQAEAAVVEVGLGGRLDATNALNPCVSAVASLSLEHTQWLGNSLDAIALEKAHIFKPGIPALVSAQAHAASPAFARHARRIGAPLYAEGEAFHMEAGAGGLCWEGFGRRLEGLALGLRGAHQVANAALALACVEASPFHLEEAALKQGLKEARWPGRMEYFEGPVPVLLDGAHNPAGMEVLAAALEAEWPEAEIHLVFSVLEDKALKEMAARLFARCATIHLAPLAHARARPVEACLPVAQRFCPNSFAWSSVEEALQKACASCGANGKVVVAGSLYLVGEARGLLMERASAEAK